MRDISEYQTGQALTEWSGDTASLLAEMKRRAGVRTDQELARFMGAAQSTVSNWRKRDAIPEAAILQFEKAASDPDGNGFSRSLAARTIALRLPELWFARFQTKGALPGRYVPYAAISYNLNAIVAEIARQMESLETTHNLSTHELAMLLIEDEKFLNGVLDRVSSTSMSDMLTLEIDAERRARRT
ncbi:helix-turn-helix domain-containing protein [Sphingomonas floccifaciens]|uniref:Helix-turn-helix domain-containing protein n=1 Tax=Sphingomonas floccifaciens TaxID=1844115 RepID=A0ABW4NCB0_9SPHN